MPEHLTFEDAAALPGAAWNSLASVRAGETVVTQGSGGVSLFALQFSKLMGARVIATTSDDAKGERLKALGAAHIINYRQRPDWHLAVLDATGGRGADHVIEIGGPATLGGSIQSAALGGQIQLVGTLAGGGVIDTTVFPQNIVSIRWAAVGSRADFEAMNWAISIHGLRWPVIDQAFPFLEAKRAFRHFIDRPHFARW
jgi:NADPH:quinone reductase-like Zn-dependent oxidoreductase